MASMVRTAEETCFLEIGIPTFNRAAKLKRLLSILQGELSSVAADVGIRVTVSDNHSDDGTAEMLQRHPFHSAIVTRRHPTNVGVSKNIWSVYESARAEYLWIIGDDDIPLPGSVGRIVATLQDKNPAVLTFEFDQPPGAQLRRHGPKADTESSTDLRWSIPHVLVLGKLTKQVVRADDLRTALTNVQMFKDTAYGWLLVILEVLKLTEPQLVVVDHEFLATCDDGYLDLTPGLTPKFWDEYLFLLDHDLVKTYCPDFAASYRYAHPIYMVKVLYTVSWHGRRTGKPNRQMFADAARELPFHWRYFRNPMVAVQWASLRLGLPSIAAVSQACDGLSRIKQVLPLHLGRRAKGGQTD